MSLLQMSVSASMMIFFILLIRLVTLNKLPKRTFLILWDIVLIRLMLPLSLPSTWSAYTFLPKNVLPSDRTFLEQTPLIGTNAAMDRLVSHISYAKLPEVSVHHISILPILWGIGCVGFALYFVISYLRCYREFAMALPIEQEFVTTWQKEHPLRRSYRILQTDCITSPLTYGVFRPVILLPKHIKRNDTEHLNYMLLHEWTHIRHMDALRKMLFLAAACIHWCNPLVWLMFRQVNADMEMTCDEGVLRYLKGDYRSAYAMTLIHMEERRSIPSAMFFGKTTTKKRIFAIMKTRKLSFSRIVVSAALILGMILCFTTSAAAAEQKVISPEYFTQTNAGKSLSGTWKLDGVETEQHLQHYNSLQEMFGTGVSAYGAELTIQNNLAVKFWIGIGPVYNGILEARTSETYSATVEDSQHLVADSQPITLYLTEEAGTTWLVMEFMGEQLYWTYTK